MNISHEACLDTIESQRLVDGPLHQRKRRYFPINLTKRAILRTIYSPRFLHAEGEGTPSMGDTPFMGDTESGPDLFNNIKYSDFFSFPGVYVPMDTEIFSAVSAGKKECLQKLRSYGKKMACLKSDQGDSVLHLAAAWGHLELVIGIVSEFPCLLLEPDSKGQLPLHLAARSGHVAVVEAIIAAFTFVSATLSKEEKERINVYVVKDKDGDTALHLALNSDLKIAPFLIKADQQSSFLANKGRISPLYMAVEIGDVSIVKAMLKPRETDGHEGRRSNIYSQLEGKKNLVHVALKAMNTDVLDLILKEYPSLEDERDQKGRTCLSFGASIGFNEGVCKLLDRSTKSVYVCNDDGSFPIHIAVEKKHIGVVKEILNRCPDSIHLLNKQGQNIFHIASRSGKATTALLKCYQKTGRKNQLIDEQDVDGNTPMHLATMMWRPRALLNLTFHCKETSIFTPNNKGLTAMDIAESNMHQNYIFMERVTLMVLLFYNGKRITKRSDPPAGGNYKDYVHTLLVVAALIATMTFAAGFTIPGGFNDSDPKLGRATLASDRNLLYFMVFDILALQNSIFTITTLIWAQLGDPSLLHRSLNVALPSLFFALLCMPAAFYYGVLVAFVHAKGFVIFLNVTFFIFFFLMLFVLGPHVFLQTPGLSYIFGYFLPFVLLLHEDDEQTSALKISSENLVENQEDT